MEKRWTISEETKEMGIEGNVCLLDHPATRVYARHMLICILKGYLNCTYEDRALLLEPGSLLFVMEGKPFKFTPDECTVLFFSIPVTCFPELTGEIHFHSDPGMSPDPGQLIRSLIADLIIAQYQGGIHYELRLQAIWKECIYLLMTGFLEAPGISSRIQKKSAADRRRDSDFHNILELLNRSYMEPLQLKDIADSFFYTPSHLSRLFFKYTGMHFMEYLTKLRLQKAMPMLMQTGQKVQLIAEKAGFPNARAFSQAFHERYGMNPSDYRRSLFQDSGKEGTESLRENIRLLNGAGYFEVFFEKERLAGRPASEIRPLRGDLVSEKASSVLSAPRLYDWKDAGSFSWNLSGQPSSVSGKHSILNIPRLRDLLLDEVQDQVRYLQKTLHFEFINCHGFLSDDMQIFTPGTAVFGTSRKFEYNFMLYEKVLRFIKSQNLKLIIQLGNTPSFLAGSTVGKALHDGSILAIPESDTDWEDYITHLFMFLRDTFAGWIESCPVIPCPDMEYAVVREDGDMNGWFAFYLRTSRIIERIMTDVHFSSPPFSSTGEGLRFAKSFLEFCKKKDCNVQSVNINFVKTLQTLHPFHFLPLELHSFVAELRYQMHLLKYPADIPVQLLEYYYTFRFNAICDSCIGAMFPINMVLLHQQDFERFGYWYACDRTTESAIENSEFYGGKGFLNQYGNRKASWYSLRFLSRLGSECIETGDGFILTRSGRDLRLLLYYDIPENTWPEPLNPEKPDEFISLFPERRAGLHLKEIPGDALRITEEIINCSNSAFEKWQRSGGELLKNTDRSDAIFDTVPELVVKEASAADHQYDYVTFMLPFEIRFVTIQPLLN